jgi:hypothetical protein
LRIAGPFSFRHAGAALRMGMLSNGRTVPDFGEGASHKAAYRPDLFHSL